MLIYFFFYFLQLSVRKKQPVVTMANVILMVNACVMSITLELTVIVSILNIVHLNKDIKEFRMVDLNLCSFSAAFCEAETTCSGYGRCTDYGKCECKVLPFFGYFGLNCNSKCNFITSILI